MKNTFRKAIKVIASCETLEQVKVAENYAALYPGNEADKNFLRLLCKKAIKVIMSKPCRFCIYRNRYIEKDFCNYYHRYVENVSACTQFFKRG